MFLALALAAVFVGGLARLFFLRYQLGDIYPPYSSLRADPLGTKALATALDELPNVEVRRNFKELSKLRPPGPVTLVYAGVDHHAVWTNEELATFNSLVLNGSRAVFTFFPVEKPRNAFQDKLAGEEQRQKKKEKTDAQKSDEQRKKDAKVEKKATKEEKKTSKPEKDKSADDGKKTQDKKSAADEEESERVLRHGFSEVAKRWGFDFGYLPEEKGKTYDRHAALIEPGGHLEPDISWHSAIYFRDLKPQWKVLYMCGTMPVVIERKFGNGSIILASDSFFISNEALRGERHPKLIAWLFAGPSPIIFDEEHNDLRENPGIASLARKYHLHGVVAGLVLMAIFFVWKNMVRFVPAYAASRDESNVVEGKESGEGFVNLLRRSIAPAAIFGVCHAEWRKTFSGAARELARAEEAAGAGALARATATRLPPTVRSARPSPAKSEFQPTPPFYHPIPCPPTSHPSRKSSTARAPKCAKSSSARRT